MSLQRSVGDLVPQDIAAILARERNSAKSRKRRGGSLSRAFRWLKSRRKKKNRASGGNTNGLTGKVGDGRAAGKHVHQHGHDVAKGLSKEEEESRPSVSELCTENVFSEDSSRPQYLQDLHSEAQEGRKILQEEENGMDYQDDESVVSTVTQTGDDVSMADSVRTVGSAVSVSKASVVSLATDASAVTASTVSTRSSRSPRTGLTRQGSTFKPLSGGRRPEKSKRRSKRATVAGIPQHVQRELGLDRGPWPTSPTSPTLVQLPNGEGMALHSEEVDALPDPGGTPEGVRLHLAALEDLESAEEQQLQRHHMHALYSEGLAVARSAGPRHSPGRRSKSKSKSPVQQLGSGSPVLGPGPSGSPSDSYPSSPVMYISPQATYLSKIIPDAILPGEIDIIEISRKGRNRGSVRTLSKGSLTAPSPSLSRASWDGDSDSSHTMVSDSSTISSGGGRGRQAKQKAVKERVVSPTSPDRVSLHSSISYASNITSVSQQVSSNNHQDNASFGRSLSVKKSKKSPPAPPRRTNSLHPNRLRRRSRDLLNSPVRSSSPSYSADQSQISSSSSTVAGPPPQLAAVKQSILRTLSPSSGYSSQSPAISSSSGGLQPPQPILSKVSPMVAAILGFGVPPLDIPAAPRVKAPTRPPPETWIHDQRSFDMLCGPRALRGNLFVALQKVRLDRERQRKQQELQCRPLVAGGTAATVAQKKEPPPVMKKSGSVKLDALKHTPSPALMLTHGLTPPPSPPSARHPRLLSSESDSSWPLPPPPPLELLPGSAFEGQDEPDVLPPPPLQLSAPVGAMPPVLVPPASVTKEVLLTVQEAPPPHADTLSLPPGIPPPPQEAPPPPPQVPPVVQEILPPAQNAPPPPLDTEYLTLGIPPPPNKPPPPPPQMPPIPQEPTPVPSILAVPPLPQEPTTEPSTLEIQSVSLDVPQLPQEAPPALEVPPPPQEVPPVPQEVVPPTQEILPVTLEATPVPQEVPPVQLEVLPPTQEAVPVPQEVLAPTQEVQSVQQEVLPSTLEIPFVPPEAPPASQKVLCPPQEASLAPQTVHPTPEDALPIPQEVLPPQEALPIPQEVMLTTQEVPVSPEEVLSSSVTLPIIPSPPSPQPVREQSPLTIPSEAVPANEVAPSWRPHLKSSPTPKREARVPMSTSSLLQMVRMRAGETKKDDEEKVGQNQTPETPPVTSPPPAMKLTPLATGHAPSMKLQEAIRMKTAAMSRLGSRSPRSASPSPSPTPSPSSPSPAATASFIFSKSPRKVVVEAPSSPEAQAGLKTNLVAELTRITSPTKFSSALQKKLAKVPPPVAKKPSHHGPVDEATPTTPPAEVMEQEQDGSTPMEAENGGMTNQVQPKENSESLSSTSGGAQPASTDQVSPSLPP
ncbi:hypothetical protein GJAV_G00000830 [Gymnothorax javanicus]|nr:hypothetical protein GJAV_G00000830 [Gymnothorax javanicus]